MNIGFSQEFDEHQAALFWLNYSSYKLSIENRVVLDWGCSSISFLKLLGESFKPERLIGNYIESKGNQNESKVFSNLGEIELFEGELKSLELQPELKVDYIFNNYMMQYMRPTQLIENLYRAYSLLRPGGELICLINIGSYYSRDDENACFSFPYTKHSSNENKMDGFAANQNKPPSYFNYLTPSSYFAVFARIGFEVLDYKVFLSPRKKKLFESAEMFVREKSPWSFEEELNCSELQVRLVRPVETSELDKIHKITRTKNYINDKNRDF